MARVQFMSTSPLDSCAIGGGSLSRDYVPRCGERNWQNSQWRFLLLLMVLPMFPDVLQVLTVGDDDELLR